LAGGVVITNSSPISHLAIISCDAGVKFFTLAHSVVTLPL
jgi:hypothetical protein